MLGWRRSDEPLLWLIKLEITVALVLLATPGIVELFPYIASAAGYQCTERGQCEPLKAEERIAVFTGWLTLFTGALGLATVLLWGATRTAIKDAREHSARHLRAYLRLELGGVRNVVAGETPQADVTVKNCGLTPANKVSITPNSGMQLLEFRDYDAGLWALVREHVDRASSLVPGQSVGIAISADRPLTKRDMRILARKKGVLWVFGEVTFRDAFGERHVVHFNHEYPGPSFEAKDGLYGEGCEETE